MLAQTALVTSCKMAKRERLCIGYVPRRRSYSRGRSTSRRAAANFSIVVKFGSIRVHRTMRYVDGDFAPSWKRKPKVFLESPIS